MEDIKKSNSGIKIKKYEAGSIKAYKNSVRDYYDTKIAMLGYSLFTEYLLENGLALSGEYIKSTKDIICIGFKYGSRSQKEEIKFLNNKICNLEKNEDESFSEEEKEKRLNFLRERKKFAEDNEELFVKTKPDDLRIEFYENGVDIDHFEYNKKGDEGEPVVKYSIDKPETKDYRTIKETILYRKKENSIARPFKYICTDSKVSGTVTSTTKCEERQTDKFKTTLGILYTCDGSTQVAQNTVCSQGEWSEWTINSCASEGTTQCESKKGYKYTDRVWKWYIEGNYRKYYPSGNASSKEENTYYLTSPAEGYVRDDDSEATVYKYFKTTDEVNGNTAGWIVIDDNYYTEEELFNKFKEYNFEVNSILDIKNNQNIQYEIKMEYRNRR